MSFTDDDLKRLKEGIRTGNFDFTEALLPGQMQALLARLEAAENWALALLGTDITKARQDEEAWRKACGK